MKTPLDIARIELDAGVREATGKNDGIPAERYNDGEAKAWCASFVRYCYEQCGIALPGNRWMQPSVGYLEGQLIIAGARIAEPEPGAIVTFRWRVGSDPGAGRHVEIIERVTPTAIITIGGNQPDEPGGKAEFVSRREHQRASKSIAGFFRWPKRSVGEGAA